jgi:hypothetical protein
MNDWITTCSFLALSAAFWVLISWVSNLSAHVVRLDEMTKLHQQALTDTTKLLGQILDALDRPESPNAKDE